MNSNLYCDILVNKLKPSIRNKRRGKLSKGVLFLHDNARPHTSCKTVSTIIKLGFEVLEHPAYSPDLAPSDYFLFGLLKKELKGKQFDSDEDVQKVVQDFFHTLSKSAYKEGIYKLQERWRRCIESQEQPAINVKEFEKPHQFKVHNFMGMTWCDFCGNFMWGLIAQGVRCEDCALSAHRRCSEKLPNDCCPDLKLLKRVFGADLTALVKAHNTIRPRVVDLCISEIEKRGLDAEGIYRVSGFSDDIDALRVAIDKDFDSVDISANVYEDINVIAGVLKLYFRLLPIPLITFEAYPNFMSAIKQATLQDKVECTRLALNHLPPAHYQTLKFLVAHLNRVSQYHSKNLMTAHNLSTVFCPTLLRSSDGAPPSEQLAAWQQESVLIELLITHHNILFASK
ncbi:CHN1 [Cordylochernes scorpioides]|uniref:CHN1 n=1 Tax=Cordylochernes scorpioides TaxID=51811 RepID=A0ABY6LY20_9ARAC|nr:CHN1 [Cordylochernes scorpioides]